MLAIDDLPSHRQIAVGAQPIVKGVKQHGNRLGFSQPFAEKPDRVGIGRWRAQIKAQEAQPAQPVTDQILHAGISHATPLTMPPAWRARTLCAARIRILNMATQS